MFSFTFSSISSMYGPCTSTGRLSTGGARKLYRKLSSKSSWFTSCRESHLADKYGNISNRQLNSCTENSAQNPRGSHPAESVQESHLADKHGNITTSQLGVTNSSKFKLKILMVLSYKHCGEQRHLYNSPKLFVPQRHLVDKYGNIATR